MPTMMVERVERVLITLPQAQRISASMYLGCMSVFIKRGVKLSFARGMTSRNLKRIGCRQTLPIHLRYSHTALSEVRLRESKIFFAAAPSRPFFKLLKASFVLMATYCNTLGSR